MNLWSVVVYEYYMLHMCWLNNTTRLTILTSEVRICNCTAGYPLNRCGTKFEIMQLTIVHVDVVQCGIRIS